MMPAVMLPEDREEAAVGTAPEAGPAESRDLEAPTAPEPPSVREDERPQQGTPVPGSLIQHRVLNVVEEVATAKAASRLLSTTGPFAELKKADIRRAPRVSLLA